MNIDEIVNRYGLEKTTTRDLDRYSNSAVLKSWLELANVLPDGFTNVDGWDDGDYRVTFVSDRHRAIANYCEGDLSLYVAHSIEAYKKEIVNCHNFYVVQNYGGKHSVMPEDQPIAASAIEEIPGVNEQFWRQYHLIDSDARRYDEPIISHSDKTIVLAKAAEIMMTNPNDFQKLTSLVGREVWNKDLVLFYQYPPYGSGRHFSRESLYNILVNKLPEEFANINEPNSHIELKNWVWYWFSSTCDHYKALPWLQSYNERNAKAHTVCPTLAKLENYPSSADYFFDLWELKAQGAVKMPPINVRVTYRLAGQPRHYDGKVIAYRDVSEPTIRKQYIVQPDDTCPESVGYLIYWLERNSFDII